MTARKKWLGAVTATAGLAALLVWRIEAASARILTRTHPLPAKVLAVAPAPDMTKEGARLVRLNGCAQCHGDKLTGGVEFSGWFGSRLVAPNLTRLAHRQSPAQLAAAIRFGVKPDGTSVIDMPSDQFLANSDAAIAAMIAYLRSLPQRPDTAGKTSWRIDGRTILALGLLPAEASQTDLSRRGPVQTPTQLRALGHYVTQTQCAACHGRDLSGDTANDSPDLSIAIRHYSLASFRHFFATGQASSHHEAPTMGRMIRRQFHNLTEAEVDGVYAYLTHNRPADY
jgi:mono/diheme cytochrome c family protein